MAATLLRLLVLFFLVTQIQGRILKLNSSDNNLVSDGVDTHHVGNQTSDAIGAGAPSIPNTCDHQYGFLPCAENAAGYIFQILVYQGLLMFGEKQIGNGSKVLFGILGVGKFGGIVFRILMSLPSMMLMIVSGVFSSKENAQSQVSLGVGIYAGITVFSLTLQWGICVIFGRRKLTSKPDCNDQDQSNDLQQTSCVPQKLSALKDTGVTLDRDTQSTAGIVVLSLVPYVVVQLVGVFHTSSGNRTMILIALIVSCFSLLSYFIYQILNPWVQERSLDYIKYEMLRTGFLQHVQRQGQLVDEHGKLNTDVLKKLFDQTDADDNQSITKRELASLVLEILQSGKVKVDEQFAMKKMMETFDVNDDRTINEEEFIEGCTKWIHETNEASESGHSPSKNIFELFKVFKESKENDPKEIDQIMSKFLVHAQTQLLKSEALITEDGKPNVDRIKTLFRQFDSDKDKTISSTELTQLLSTVKFGELEAKSKNIIKELFIDFDTDGDHIINEAEFIEGVSKWLDKAVSVAKTQDTSKAVDEFNKIMWKKPVLDKWAFTVSLFQLILGILVLTFLGGPLMTSILQLSFAMNLPSFSISFIIVPLAMNARAAITAFMPASQKSQRSASLTFSEIYGAVIMNNIAGLTTLLAIVYANDLTWDFSAEVFTILFVGAVIGILAYKCKTYPLWTCILAFALYPLSLTLYYFVQVFLSWD